MKQNILKIGILLFVFTTLFSACKKQKEDLLVGNTYIETFPIKNGYAIHFIDRERLTITREEDDIDTITYKIQRKKIIWRSVQHYFRIINRNKFEIGYLRPYIPEEYPGNMIFEKVK
ncbi:MAG: hypothetical protein LBU90_00710 [Bacteroidales bacterium]|jgi:hypothetical protein|nr:hypothetical protein [Bacteroidales bacterium]